MIRTIISLSAIAALSACAIQQPEIVKKEPSQDVSYWFQSLTRAPDVAAYPSDPEHVLTVPREDRNFVVVRVKNYNKPKVIPAPTFSPAEPVVQTSPSLPIAAVKKEPEVVETIVHFPFDKAGLTSKSKQELDAFIKSLGGNLTTSVINVEAYADAKGTSEYNLKLTTKRAATVADYFVSKGAPSASVHAIGMGQKDPVASNKTEEGRAENRRADVHVIYKD
jgi:outer membrane protein OmpA-like peptidoglycan-associated protein